MTARSINISSSWQAASEPARILSVGLARFWFISTLIGTYLWSFSDTGRFFIVFSTMALNPWVVISLWAIAPVLALIWAVRLLLGRQVRRALVWLSLPVVGMFVYFVGAPVGEALRFYVTRAAYERAVADAIVGKCSLDDRKRWNVPVDAIDCQSPVTIVFIWTGMGSLWRGVVYDGGDEIDKPPGMRSSLWKHREIGSMLSCSGSNRAMGGHFYLASGDYASGIDECG